MSTGVGLIVMLCPGSLPWIGPCWIWRSRRLRSWWLRHGLANSATSACPPCGNRGPCSQLRWCRWVWRTWSNWLWCSRGRRSWPWRTWGWWSRSWWSRWALQERREGFKRSSERRRGGCYNVGWIWIIWIIMGESAIFHFLSLFTEW